MSGMPHYNNLHARPQAQGGEGVSEGSRPEQDQPPLSSDSPQKTCSKACEQNSPPGPCNQKKGSESSDNTSRSEECAGSAQLVFPLSGNLKLLKTSSDVPQDAALNSNFPSSISILNNKNQSSYCALSPNHPSQLTGTPLNLNFPPMFQVNLPEQSQHQKGNVEFVYNAKDHVVQKIETIQTITNYNVNEINHSLVSPFNSLTFTQLNSYAMSFEKNKDQQGEKINFMYNNFNAEAPTVQKDAFLKKGTLQKQVNRLQALPCSTTVLEQKRLNIPQPELVQAKSADNYEEFDDYKYLENGKFERFYKEVVALGRGAFGTVFKAKHNIRDDFCAVKVIIFKIHPHERIKDLKYFREVQNMLKLTHEKIVRLYTSWWEVYNHKTLDLGTSPDNNTMAVISQINDEDSSDQNQ